MGGVVVPMLPNKHNHTRTSLLTYFSNIHTNTFLGFKRRDRPINHVMLVSLFLFYFANLEYILVFLILLYGFSRRLKLHFFRDDSPVVIFPLLRTGGTSGVQNTATCFKTGKHGHAFLSLPVAPLPLPGDPFFIFSLFLVHPLCEVLGEKSSRGSSPERLPVALLEPC